ncbi:MAG TPA: transposase [bacterium]|nr:transposase [bacterium]
MRIKGYDYKADGYYFVTICTAKRKPLLSTCKKDVEEIICDLPNKFKGIKIDFYNILPDHIHIIFIFDGSNTTLSNVVRTLKALVTIKTKNRPFWEWNYYEHVIRNEGALYQIRKYVEENSADEKIDFKKIYSGINATATKKIT